MTVEDFTKLRARFCAAPACGDVAPRIVKVPKRWAGWLRGRRAVRKYLKR